LVTLATEKGGDAAVSRYRQLKKESPDKYDFSEGALQEVGFQLFQAKKLPEAIALLRLNTEQYPKSSAAFMFLGYMQLQADSKGEAAVSLQKAVELDPKNAQAASFLKQAQEK
jgi:cytochrome c-type biogenesis protein CcmH/NrfG